MSRLIQGPLVLGRGAVFMCVAHTGYVSAKVGKNETGTLVPCLIWEVYNVP